MKYIFITVNYNNAVETIKYIKSINSISYKGSENISIIVVDNHSDSDNYSNLESFCLNCNSPTVNIIVIRNIKNVGYFAGLNVGLDSVKKIDKKTCIVGNNDITFETDFLNKIEKLDIPSETIVICPDIVNKEGKHENPQLASRASIILKVAFRIYFTSYLLSIVVFNISKIMKMYGLRKQNTSFAKEQFIYQGSGACYILPEQFFEIYQRLDDRVFLWGEERLLANQVILAERKTYYTPCLKVYHNESMSTSKVPTRDAWKINKESYKIYKHYM